MDILLLRQDGAGYVIFNHFEWHFTALVIPHFLHNLEYLH